MEPESGSISSAGLSFAGLTEFLGRPAAPCGDNLPPGTRLGDVTVIRLVGEGGMGRVYEGLQGTPCRTVAVKVMRSGMLSHAAARRFEHEVHILGRLTHPGIARIYSVGMEQMPDGAVPYFVMEYIEEGRSITAHAAQRDLSIRDRVVLFREACQAVAHGHHKGIIHRDIKPGNILVDAIGQPKVIDFGVARSTDGDIALTTLQTDVGQIVGTLRYMCPEQFEGSSENLDVRADVYALGMVLYELLAGRPPYDLTGQAVYEVARVVRETEPTSLSGVNPQLRGDLETIVAKCLEKDRSRRYSSAAELEADLGRYLRGEPIAARPPGLLESIVRLARRHQLVATAAAGVAVAIALAFVGITIFAVRAERQRVIAVDARKQADAASQEAIRQLYVANMRSLQAALDGRNLRLARQLHAENLAIAGTPPPLEMHLLGAGLDDALAVLDVQKGPVGEIAYSPDGDILAAMARVPPKFSTPGRIKEILSVNPSSIPFHKSKELLLFAADSHDRYAGLRACDEDWLKMWRVDNGAAESLADVMGLARGTGAPLAVSADGLRLAVHDQDGSVRVVRRSTGVVEAILADFRGRVKRAVFGADGTRVAIQSPTGKLGLWDAVSGRLVVRFGDNEGVRSFHFSPDGSRIAIVDDVRHQWTDVRLHDAWDGRHLSTVTRPRGLGTLRSSLLAFGPDGSRLLTTSHETDLHLWETATGRLISTLRGHVGFVTTVAIDPDGTQIASGATNGNIRLWDLDTGAFQRELMGHDGGIMALAFRPGRETLASGSHDGTVRIWSCTAREPLAVLPGLRGMTAVAFSPNGLQLAVAAEGAERVELWNPRTVERLFTCDVAGGTVAQLAYHPDGDLVAAACNMPGRPGEVRVWRTDTGERLSTLGGLGGGVERLAFSPDGKRLLTVSGDAVATVWDVHTGRQFMEFASEYKGPFADIDAVFVLDGSRVNYRSVHLLDAATGDTVMKMRQKGHVTCVATSPDRRVLASGVATGTVYLDDCATGERLAWLTGHTDRVRSIAFSADGDRVVTGSLDNTARLWDARSGNEIRLLKGHESCVEAALFTPDCRRIVTAETDGTIRIWDFDRGQILATLPGQRDFPRAFALSPDGTLLVAAASDGPIRIWGLSNAAVTRARAAAAEAADAAAPRASQETQRDRPGPAG